jgi:hypothetical protein
MLRPLSGDPGLRLGGKSQLESDPNQQGRAAIMMMIRSKVRRCHVQRQPKLDEHSLLSHDHLRENGTPETSLKSPYFRFSLNRTHAKDSSILHQQQREFSFTEPVDGDELEPRDRSPMECHCQRSSIYP